MIANDDPLAEARRRGWQVEMRPAGLLVNTNGRPSDPELLARLFAVMVGADQPPRDTARWPDDLLADPAEVVMRGDLAAVEREVGR